MAEAVRRNEPVLIVGAGPAGLATAAMLQRAGIASRILEAGPGVGTSWLNYYDSLRLHTGRRISGLPGYPLPRGYPVFVARPAYLQYLRAYARRFNLAITPRQRVLRAERAGDLWRLHTEHQVWEAPVLVAASGIASRPSTPQIPGMESFGGAMLHSSEYHDAAPFSGKRVLVVGVGNSGSEIALDLSSGGADVALAIRNGITVVPRVVGGVPVSYIALLLSYLPEQIRRAVRAPIMRRTERRLRALGLKVGSPDDFPVIGLEILDAIREERVQALGGVVGFEPDGARFEDGTFAPADAVVLATGFRPALDYLAGYIVPPDQKQARLPVRAAPEWPNLYFVGLYYDGLVGTLFQIGRQSRLVADAVKKSGAAHLPDAWVERAGREPIRPGGREDDNMDGDVDYSE
ncbi:MAG: flavin-containing monooxygenase [Chloroflexia bacterium]